MSIEISKGSKDKGRIGSEARRLGGLAVMEGAFVAGADLFAQRREIMASGLGLVEEPVTGIIAGVKRRVRREVHAIRRIDKARVVSRAGLAAGVIVLKELETKIGEPK